MKQINSLIFILKIILRFKKKKVSKMWERINIFFRENCIGWCLAFGLMNFYAFYSQDNILDIISWIWILPILVLPLKISPTDKSE